MGSQAATTVVTSKYYIQNTLNLNKAPALLFASQHHLCGCSAVRPTLWKPPLRLPFRKQHASNHNSFHSGRGRGLAAHPRHPKTQTILCFPPFNELNYCPEDLRSGGIAVSKLVTGQRASSASPATSKHLLALSFADSETSKTIIKKHENHKPNKEHIHHEESLN